MVAEEAEHVRKLNKNTEESWEKETYYLLTKKSRKLKKRKIACKWEDYHHAKNKPGSSQGNEVETNVCQAKCVKQEKGNKTDRVSNKLCYKLW